MGALEIGAGIDALAVLALSIFGALEIGARIVFAATVGGVADLAFWAGDACALIFRDALAVDAILSAWAFHAGAGIGDTLAFDALFACGAFDFLAGGDATSAFAEFVDLAFDACARIAKALAFGADLALRAAKVVAIVVLASAIFAGLSAWALDAAA